MIGLNTLTAPLFIMNYPTLRENVVHVIKYIVIDSRQDCFFAKYIQNEVGDR